MSLAILQSPEQWTERYNSAGRTVLTVGNFDGLHVGHQKILRLVVERARTGEQRSAVVTFDPHPLRILRPEQPLRMIQTLNQRLDGFDRLGLDAALVLRFDRELSLVPAEEFITRILVERLHVAAILVGANFNFGHRGAGNVQLLAQFGQKHDFSVEIIPPVEVAGQVVSSTAVRREVGEGNVADAASFLGRPFSLTGEIRPGAGRGRTILFPTLNLVPEQELLPKLGVYVTESAVDGSVHHSVTNVGTRPTFDGQGVTVESHLFGFDKNISAGQIEVFFRARLRDELKFSGPDQLRAQIARDIAAAKQYFLRPGTAEYSPASGM